MTHIETDNPLLQMRIWCYDITWQYWYIWIALAVIAVWLINRHFAKRQREWDEYMKNEHKKHENFKRKVREYTNK
jgi:cytochrome c-type biogenesis protein CcmH/NrfF